MPTDIKLILRDRALELGFLDARVASVTPPPAAGAAYHDWLAAGHHGEMSYMERLSAERAAGVDHILPGAKSVIVLAASYYYPEPEKTGLGEQSTNLECARLDAALNQPPAQDENPPAQTSPASPNTSRPTVRVARYALGRDYHYVLKDRLATLIQTLDAELPGHQWRACTDSAPLLERTYAAASGLGFIGKNAMLITWMQGSYTLLAEILTTAEIEPDPPRDGTCGNCTRCLDACPTQAFTGPGVLDARKCISYLTIEKKTELTDAETNATGEWAFGCDICQDVCPYNKAPEQSRISDFAPGTVVNAREPVETFLKPASNREFERRFEASPILRAGKRRLQKRWTHKS